MKFLGKDTMPTDPDKVKVFAPMSESDGGWHHTLIPSCSCIAKPLFALTAELEVEERKFHSENCTPNTGVRSTATHSNS